MLFWMSEFMTGKERINRVLKGEIPDRQPVMLHNFMMAAREEGITMKQFREDPVKAAYAFIHATEKYDLDAVLIDIDTVTLAGAAGAVIDFPENEPARLRKPALVSLDELPDLEMPDISADPRIQNWVEVCHRVKKYFGDEKYIRGNCDQAPFSLASMIRGLEEWLMDLVRDDEYTFRLLDFATEICIQFIKLIADTGVDMVSNGDSTAGPEMISPALYRKYAFPFEKKVVDFAHHLGLPYALHICGDTGLILEEMLDTGADAFELDFKTDVKQVMKIFSSGKTFIGNIDPSGIICLGTEDDVEDKVNELMENFTSYPGLIVNAGCAIPAETPESNIFRLVDTVRNYKPG
jgi:uroporphyrinogen decarboxylase